MIDIATLKDILCKDSEILKYIKDPKDACFECAVRVSALLRARSISHRIVALLFWSAYDDAFETHYFVTVFPVEPNLVSIELDLVRMFAIDLTAGQFARCEPLVDDYSVWQDMVHESPDFKKMYIEAEVFESAHEAQVRIPCFARFKPHEFKGVPINKPRWFKKLPRTVRG